MSFPLGPVLANVFLCFYQKKWLEKCSLEFKSLFCRGYVDDHLEKFHNYFKSCHRNMSFSFEKEINVKMSFLDVEIFQENDKFVTTVYRKPTFSGVCTHFESFLPATHKFGML